MRRVEDHLFDLATDVVMAAQPWQILVAVGLPNQLIETWPGELGDRPQGGVRLCPSSAEVPVEQAPEEAVAGKGVGGGFLLPAGEVLAGCGGGVIRGHLAPPGRFCLEDSTTFD
jgi:hypothetical protein